MEIEITDVILVNSVCLLRCVARSAILLLDSMLGR